MTHQTKFPAWEFNGQRPPCLCQSLGYVRILSPMGALSGGGGCFYGGWASGALGVEYSPAVIRAVRQSFVKTGWQSFLASVDL